MVRYSYGELLSTASSLAIFFNLVAKRRGPKHKLSRCQAGYPRREDSDADISEDLIVEFYARDKIKSWSAITYRLHRKKKTRIIRKKLTETRSFFHHITDSVSKLKL